MFLFVSLSGSFSGGPSPETIYICDMTHDLWEDGEAIYLIIHDHNGGGRDGISPPPLPQNAHKWGHVGFYTCRSILCLHI